MSYASSAALLELLGGFPGAILGSKLFRHKTQKTRYRVVTFTIVLLHIAAWTAWLLLPRI